MRDKAFKIARDAKYCGYQRGLAGMIYSFFDKKFALLNKSSGSGIVNESIINWQMSLIKQLLENFKKEKFIHH